MWRLPSSVHAVAVEEDLIFLDVAADAYVCLRDAAEALEVSAGARAVRLRDEALAPRLLEAGLIETGPADPATDARFTVPPPRSSATPDVTGLPGWRDAPDAISALGALITGYVGRSFADILQAGGRCGAAVARQAPCTGLLELAVRYQTWIPYVPLPTKCLLRAFMLRRLLAWRGYEAAWVFGVSTWPVQAHCWIQRGDVVLDDTVERVRSFHPIMVV